MLRINPAKNQVRIGDGWPAPAAPIADRPGRCSSTFGAHSQRAATIHAGQRSSTRADRVDVHHGDGDGEAGQSSFISDAGTALKQADICGSPAHVEADRLADAEAPRKPDRSGNATSRPGKNRSNRLPRSLARRSDATARFHHKNTNTLATGAGRSACFGLKNELLNGFFFQSR